MLTCCVTCVQNIFMKSFEMYKFFTATASTAAAPSNRIYTKVNFKKESIENEIYS